MNLDEPKNKNYAAQVVRVPATVQLEGLDNLVGVPVLGHQALTQKDGVKEGDLKIAFTAETQLSHEYAHENNLYRDASLNADPNETGYLEKNRRIRALKLRGHRSNALLMPIDSVSFATDRPSLLKEGDTFDTLNGVEICRKYEVPVKTPRGQKSKVEKAFKRVDRMMFPEHLETDAFWRSKHLLKPGKEIVVTQKLHGTSLRVGRVPCLRQKGWFERFISKLTGVKTPDYEYDSVYGSRKVIKDANNPNQNHYYDNDLWTEYGKQVEDLIPEGFIVYGELVGWVPGTNAAIQKNYTYGLPIGTCELYVYRVAVVNQQGTMVDLPWDGVKEFCLERGLKWAPEMDRYTVGSNQEIANLEELTEVIEQDFLDKRFRDFYNDNDLAGLYPWVDAPLPLSGALTVDEGVCLRQEGLVPTILKAKSPQFLEHETKLLDKGEADIESEA